MNVRSLWSFWRRKDRQTGRARHARQHRKLEALENRQLMAGDILFADGIVTIEGTPLADDAYVQINGAELRVVLEQEDANGNLLDHQEEFYPLANVVAIVFYGYEGDDYFYNGGSYNSLPSTAYGGAGNEYFHGGWGSDTFFGGPGNDHLIGYRGDDALFGEDGNDDIYGESGQDLVDGGLGDDYLWGSDVGEEGLDASADTILGGEGADILHSGRGDDLMVGGSGDDVYRFWYSDQFGHDTIDESGGGTEWLNFYSCYVPLNLDLGATFQTVSPGHLELTLLNPLDLENVVGRHAYVGVDDTLRGNSRPNQIWGMGGDDTIFGMGGDDILYGHTPQLNIPDYGNADVLEGGDGFDFLYGGKGPDLLFGGPDQDWLFGEDGADELNGGDDRDYLAGGEHADRLAGGLGHNELVGGNGDDTYIFENLAYTNTTVSGYVTEYAGGGNDWLDFSTFPGAVTVNLSLSSQQLISPGLPLVVLLVDPLQVENVLGSIYGDTIRGNSLANTLQGLGGNDVIYAGLGNDTLLGDGGMDTLFGESGQDTLRGGAHDDYLDGGADYMVDYLYGEGGVDTFVRHYHWVGFWWAEPDQFADFSTYFKWGDKIEKKYWSF